MQPARRDGYNRVFLQALPSEETRLSYTIDCLLQIHDSFTSKLNALNMSYPLAPTVRALNHGVEVSSQNDIQSRTLVCYLDAWGNFHYGFAFRNGSNLRVACWEDDTRRNKTVPYGNSVIAFKGYQTDGGFGHKFVEADFNIPWFCNTVRWRVKEELEALHSKPDMKLDATINGLAGLAIY